MTAPTQTPAHSPGAGTAPAAGRPTTPAAGDRHPYLDDGNGTCTRCPLPAGNARHDTTHLQITVLGKPITQGSKTRTRWGMYDDNAATLKPWREAVKTVALEALDDSDWPTRCELPVVVLVDFTFDRPRSHYRTGRNAHLLRDSAPDRPHNKGSGDVDKLQRAVFDALTDAGVWKDDCQVVGVAARKLYVGEPQALHLPGARIVIEQDRPC